MKIWKKWLGWSLLWSFGAMLLVLLGYYLALVGVAYPGQIQSPFDEMIFFLIPRDFNTVANFLFIIETVIAFIAVWCLEYSKNKLRDNKEEIKAWKASVGKDIEKKTKDRR
jgi:hypothetical protein